MQYFTNNQSEINQLDLYLNPIMNNVEIKQVAKTSGQTAFVLSGQNLACGASVILA